MNLQGFTSSDGVKLVYYDWGPPDADTIVLCHGLAATAEQFFDDALFFSRRFRVLVPDLRGHGRSGSPSPMTAAGFSIERLAADLIEMLDHARARQVHWVGNSLGGIVALEMLAANRFATLATFGTTYTIQLPQIGGHRLVPLGHRLLGRQAAAAITANSTSRDPAARQLIEKILRDMRPDVTAILAGVLTRYDLIAKGVAATLPILMIRGGQDRLVNAGLGSTLAAMRKKPNFRLVDLPMGGHCANLDARDAFRAALLDFWKDASPSPAPGR